MLGKKIIILTLIVLTFLSPVVAINIDLEITNQDYQTMRNCKDTLDKDMKNAKKNFLKDHNIEDADVQNVTLKSINMDCNSVHTSKLSFNAGDEKDSTISILTNPEF